MVEEKSTSVQWPESEELQETGPSSQDTREGLLRGSGNVQWPERQQGARREWVWRICPPKVGLVHQDALAGG